MLKSGGASLRVQFVIFLIQLFLLMNVIVKPLCEHSPGALSLSGTTLVMVEMENDCGCDYFLAARVSV